MQLLGQWRTNIILLQIQEKMYYIIVKFELLFIVYTYQMSFTGSMTSTHTVGYDSWTNVNYLNVIN